MRHLNYLINTSLKKVKKATKKGKRGPGGAYRKPTENEVVSPEEHFSKIFPVN